MTPQSLWRVRGIDLDIMLDWNLVGGVLHTKHCRSRSGAEHDDPQLGDITGWCTCITIRELGQYGRSPDATTRLTAVSKLTQAELALDAEEIGIRTLQDNWLTARKAIHLLGQDTISAARGSEKLADWNSELIDMAGLQLRQVLKWTNDNRDLLVNDIYAKLPNHGVSKALVTGEHYIGVVSKREEAPHAQNYDLLSELFKAGPQSLTRTETTVLVEARRIRELHVEPDSQVREEALLLHRDGTPLNVCLELVRNL